MPTKIKVLHINANTAGGAFVVAQRLHEALNFSAEVESRHLVFDGNAGNYNLWARTPLKKGIAIFNHAADKLDFLKYEASPQIRFQFNHASRGIDISKHPLVQEADIIHFHWVHKGFLSFKGLETLLKLDKKFIWTCHDLWPVTGGCYYTWGCDHLKQGCYDCKFLKNPGNPDKSTQWYAQKERLWGSGQIRFITPSKWLAEIGNTSKMMSSPQMKPIKPIPNAIDTSFFKPLNSEDKFKLRTDLGLNPVLPTIMFSAANLNNPAKGFEYFLELIQNLTKRDFAAQFLVLGREFEKPVSNELPIKWVGFESNIQEILRNYQAADIYVTTAIEDNLPTTVMEALSSGLPCFGFKVGGIPELIDNSVNGFVVETKDVDSMEEMIILSQPNWEQLSKAARSKAVSTYDVSVVVNQVVSEYKTLLQ